MSAEKLNIVLITCHDLGRRLGCYSLSTYGVNGEYERTATPSIDTLAEKSVVFTNHFSAAPTCSPARSALLTGRYPHEVNQHGLAHLGYETDAEVTIAKLLSAAGYTTALFGLEHICKFRHVSALGYDHVYAEQKPGEVAEATTGKTINFLTHYASGARQKPLFLEVNYWQPHRDWNTWARAEFDGNVIPPHLRPYGDKAAIQKELAMLDASIDNVDLEIGRLLNSLQETGFQDNTVIILTTDHGIAMPGAKTTLYDPGIRTALIMYHPDMALGGKAYHEMLSNVDVLPSIMEIAGIKTPDIVQGRSFIPLLQGRSYEPREEVFSGLTWHDGPDPKRAIRTHQWKLIRSFGNYGPLPSKIMSRDISGAPSGISVDATKEYSGSPRQEVCLFNLSVDPLETTNLADDVDHQAIREELEARLLEQMRETSDPLIPGGEGVPASEQMQERLANGMPQNYRWLGARK